MSLVSFSDMFGQTSYIKIIDYSGSILYNANKTQNTALILKSEQALLAINIIKLRSKKKKSMNRYLNVSCITIFLFTNCHDPLDNM